MNNVTIGIIGCGHMGSAIAESLVQSGRAVVVSNPTRPQVRAKWMKGNIELAKKSGIVVICVKPGMVEEVLKEIRPGLTKSTLVISVAAGVTMHRLSKWSGGHKKIIRCMPNLPAQIGFGMTVWMATKAIANPEKKMAKEIFSSFGNEVEVKKESQINAATAVSGGAPAYTAAFLESMSISLQKSGYKAEDAHFIALSAVLGSALYIGENSIDFTELKKAVQTKGGTTEAAFKILNKKSWQKTLEIALQGAQKRAEEIGNS